MDNLLKRKIYNGLGAAIVVILGLLTAAFSQQIYDGICSLPILEAQAAQWKEAAAPITYGNYIPGTYTAEAYGFESDITVKLEVSETEILSLGINANGDSDIGRNGAKQIKEAVLSGQTAEVDAIAGATFTTQAAIDAIKDALKQASKR